MNLSLDDDRLTQLLAQVAGRDRAALKALYEATAARLYGVALRVLGNREHAEDVLQDAFLSVWTIAGDYRRSLSPPMAWLGMVVRSRAIDHLRRRTAERHLATQASEDGFADREDEDSPGPMDLSMASEQAWALNQCLQRIESKPRELLVLAYFRDLSHREIAEQQALPLGTVKTWIRRSLEQLRTCLARFV